MTMKQDWYITLDEGVTNKELIKLFAQEAGVDHVAPETLSEYNNWCKSTLGDYLAGGTINKSDKNHFSIPSQWKEALDYIKSSPLEVGKWYKHSDYTYQVTELIEKYSGFKVTNYIDDSFIGEGYKEDTTFPMCNHSTPVELTQEELKEHLFKIAEHKGFKPGVKYLGVEGRNKDTPQTIDTLKMNDLGVYSRDSYIYYFESNKWGKVVSNSLPKINGYVGVLSADGTTIKYGCAEMSAYQTTKLSHLIKNFTCLYGNREIASITLDSGVTISSKQIHQIAEYIENEK